MVLPRITRFQIHYYRWAIGLVGTAILLSGCERSLSLPPLPTLPPLLNERSPDPAPTIATQSTDTAAMEAFVYEQINAIRRQQGLTEFRQNAALADVARRYSQRMAEEDFFSHTSPTGDTMVDRVTTAGIFYTLLGENLFTSTNLADPAPAAVEGWMNSPGHRDNILREGFRETGVGVWRVGNTYYFTQLFMRSL